MSPVSSPSSTVANFFTSFYSQKPDDSWVLIWTLPDKYSYWSQDIAQVSDYVGDILPQKNVYVQLALSPQNYGPQQRCKAEDVIGIVGLHSDLDYGARGHKKGNLPPTEESAYNILTAGELPPTMIVNSGGGLWGHWLLQEPWIFRDSEDRRK